MTTIDWNQFPLTSAPPGPRPFVLVTPDGPTDGGDFGPNSPIWSGGSGTSQTGGIQEALYWLGVNAPNGGTIFIAGGTYDLTTGLVNTGSNQVVVFEGGVTLDFSGATPIQCSSFGSGFSAWISVASSFDSSNKANWSHNAWYGNGCSITGLPDVSGNSPSLTPAVFCLFQFGQFDGFSASAAGEDFVIDGFVMLNMPVMQRAWFVGVDQYTSIPMTSAGLSQKIRDIKFSRIEAAWGSSGAASINSFACEMNFLHGAWHNVLIEDCSMDAFLQSSRATSNGDCGTLFAHANAGDGENLVVRRSYFRGVGQWEVIEFQGQNAGTSNNPHVFRTAQNFYLEDCTFDAAVAGATPNYNALFIDDTLSNDGYGLVNNIEFRRCMFIGCAASFTSSTSAFGYVRFVDCFEGSSGGAVQNFPQWTGVLHGRFPMWNSDSSASNFSNVAVGASPWTYVNNDALDEIVSVAGGSGVVVSWPALGNTGTTGTYRLRPGDAINIAYVSAPVVSKFAI